MSTIKLYHERRYKLLVKICGRSQPVCERCGIVYDLAELHIHHINPFDGHGRQKGGWQHLYKLEKDFKDDKALMVVCKRCHKEIHEVLPRCAVQ